MIWYHQQESNLYLALRRHSFCPLNYGGSLCMAHRKLYALSQGRAVDFGLPDGALQLNGIV